jgi:hypothetical protein
MTRLIKIHFTHESACPHRRGLEIIPTLVFLFKGTCTCAPGYMGELCERKCESGWFGLECSLVCNCHDDNSIGCDPVTGTCLCKPEWGGVQCETRCPPGHYGKDCNNICECQNNSSCDPVTGQCACARGWEGENCSSPCKQGYYGLGCKEKCPDMIYGKETVSVLVGAAVFL